MAVNFRNRISMQPNEKLCHGVKGPPFFLVCGGRGGFFLSSCVWCGEWTTCPVDFPCKLFFFFLKFRGWFKSKSSQVPDMFPKEFPKSPQRKGTLCFKIEPSVLWSLHSFFFDF